MYFPILQSILLVWDNGKNAQIKETYSMNMSVSCGWSDIGLTLSVF